MNQPDYTDRNGSGRLRAQIVSYWALRCGDLERPVVNIVTPYVSAYGGGELRQMERARYDLRSDMINGTPRGFAWRWDGRKWGLIRNEAHERTATARVVGAPDAGGARGVPSQTRSGAESQPVLRAETRPLRQARRIALVVEK